jgi:predicted DNA-binding transcriptional regulator YafY
MSQPTARILAVLDLLQTHGRLRGEEIAARLEVDVRTVRRYVLILRDRGIPIEMLRGRYGGYRLQPGFKTPLALTEREAFAVTSGLLSLREQRLTIAAEDSEQALAKIARVLPAHMREIVRHLEHAVTFAFPAMLESDAVAPEHLEVILRAIRARQRIHLSYRSWAGDLTERAVDPYQVVYRYGRWYLVGYCHLRADQRVFRLDHIQAARALAASADIPPEIDALAVVEQALARIPWRYEYRVRLSLPLPEARRRIPITLAELEEQEGGVLMHGYAEELPWLAYLLAGLGCPLVVLHPPELRAQLVALAEHVRAIGTAAPP